MKIFDYEAGDRGKFYDRATGKEILFVRWANLETMGEYKEARPASAYVPGSGYLNAIADKDGKAKLFRVRKPFRFYRTEK
jgi:hypothetical protein